jgi:ribonucleoside-diphosphate reductase 2, operon protein nrdI
VMVDQPFHLVTFTTGVGQVPALVERFLQQHRHLLQSVTVSGNMNWGQTFGRAGDIIARDYHVPLLLKYELAGNDQVLQQIISKIEEFYGS